MRCAGGQCSGTHVDQIDLHTHAWQRMDSGGKEKQDDGIPTAGVAEMQLLPILLRSEPPHEWQSVYTPGSPVVYIVGSWVVIKVYSLYIGILGTATHYIGNWASGTPWGPPQSPSQALENLNLAMHLMTKADLLTKVRVAMSRGTYFHCSQN